MRQGRGPEFTGRFQCGCLRCGASVRAGLEEAVDALWRETEVKRWKAFLGWGEPARRNLSVLPWEICWAGMWCRWAEGRKDDG